MLRERIRLINPEWFREPPSRLESTLRTTYLLRHSFVLFLRRPGFKWFVFGAVIWVITQNAFPSVIIGFIISLLSELFTLKNYYERVAVPKHIKNIQLIKHNAKKIDRLTPKQLTDTISNSVINATWGLINIGYVGLSAWGWELIFKVLYPLMVKSDMPYQYLLVGFNNKATESDQALWEVAQEKNEKQQGKMLKSYLEEYGSKVDDLELAKPTLREKPKVIKKLLELYKVTPSPKSVVEKQKEKRKQDTVKILKNLRIPGLLFNKLLIVVQENVTLRENRRHYHFLADYEIRMMLLRLARLLKLSGSEIFTKSWKEILEIAKD